MRSMVEGHHRFKQGYPARTGYRPFPARPRRHAMRLCPSTMLRMVPLPGSGRNYAARAILTGIDL